MDDVGKNEKVEMAEELKFPYLDVQMFWKNSSLVFEVYVKPNQKLKYLNLGSAHTPSCYNAITSGVIKRLAKLTTVTEENRDVTMDVLYPKHVSALEVAKLSPVEGFPKLVDAVEKAQDANKKKKKSRGIERQTYFCVGVSTFWKVPIHKTLMKLRNKHGLKWLRISMSYHRFSNLRDIFQGDLSRKLLANITSLEFMDEKCNCQKSSLREGGVCMFGGKCRQKMVVYKAICLETGKYYIGQTQNNVKERMNKHVSETTGLIKGGKPQDSFARHFAELFEGKGRATAREVKDKFRVEILWQGDPISCMKTFKKVGCKLCMMERVHILKAEKEDCKNLINVNEELFGACKHNAHFHRYTEKQILNPALMKPERQKRVQKRAETENWPARAKR